MNEKKEDILLKQLFTFSTILFFALLTSYFVQYYQTSITNIKQKAAVAAGHATEVFGDVLTEDLNKNLR